MIDHRDGGQFREIAEYAVIGDLTDPVIYLADVQQDLLVPLPAHRPTRARALPVRGTLAGRVLHHT